MLQRILRWKRFRGMTFAEGPFKVGAGAHIDAAEYELQSIVRDINRVRMPVARHGASNWQAPGPAPV